MSEEQNQTQQNGPEKRESQINVRIGLDEASIPESISWQATEGVSNQYNAAEAMVLALWDSQAKEALRIDLWTKEMSKDDMDRLVFQTIMTLADSYDRAVGSEEGSKILRDMGYAFGENRKLIQRKAEDNLPPLPEVKPPQN
jgi:gliding motility-associated protein GldC